MTLTEGSPEASARNKPELTHNNGKSAIRNINHIEASEDDESDTIPDCSVNDPRYLTWTQRQAAKRTSTDRQVAILAQGFKPFQQRDSKPSFDIKSEEQALCGPLVLGFDNKGRSIEIPASINRFLRGYQRDGVRFFWNHYKKGEGGLLGDDMGKYILSHFRKVVAD